MKNKFLELQSTVGEVRFHAVMNVCEILYIKRTGAILGVAFIDRPGELLFEYTNGDEANHILKSIKREVGRIAQCHNEDD